MPGILVGIVVFLWPISTQAWLGVAGYVAIYSFFVPPPAFWFGGAPVRLEDPVLVISNIAGKSSRIDLRLADFCATSGPTSEVAHLGARCILLSHPDGTRLSMRGARRLQLEQPAVARLTRKDAKVIVISLSGVNPGAVIAPIGQALESLGIRMSPGMKLQLQSARHRSTNPLPWWKR